MITRLDIYKSMRRGIGTFLVHPEDDVLPAIIGVTGYVDGMGDRWDEEQGAVIGKIYNVIYEGINGIFVMTDKDGTFTPDPPMTLQRKVQILNEEDAYVASLKK